MSSSVKKKYIQPYWRPDYRNPSTLPDIKVVRTDFIINFIAILLVVSIGAFILQREYRAWSVGSAVADMKDRIRMAEPDDSIFLKQSESFRRAGRYIQDLERFYQAPFYAHELLYELSQVHDEDLIFKSLSFSEAAVQYKKKPAVKYRMDITGEVRDLTTLDDYVVSLRNMELFEVENYMLQVAEDPRQRNPATGLYPYSINLTLSPDDGANKKGGK